MKELAWKLFKKTGAIGYYLLAKRLEDEEEE
ncbi:MAG: YqzL family protein [Bacilli bacterium]